MHDEGENGETPACQGIRDSEGRWVKGSSGNPAGPPRGYVKLAYWMQLYAAGESIDHAPKPAREFVYAAFRDASMRPDGSGGCASTRKLLLERHDGPVRQEIEAHVTSEERRILIVGTVSADPPALPESVLQIEAQRAAAEERAQVHRVIEAGRVSEETEGDG